MNRRQARPVKLTAKEEGSCKNSPSFIYGETGGPELFFLICI